MRLVSAVGLGVGVCLSCCLSCSCRDHRSAPRGGTTETSSPEPPVAAPEGHVLDIVAAAPDALWSRVQRAVGGILGILPPSYGGLLTAWAGLDPSFSRGIDGAAPAFAVIAARGAHWSFAIATKLREGDLARDALFGGDAGKLEAKRAGPIAILAPRAGAGGTFGVAVGLARSGASTYLLVADAETSLARLGPYAYRTLPARPAPESGLVADAPRDALGGALSAEVESAWSAAKTTALRSDADLRALHGGRAPDFGDAPSIVTVADRIVSRVLALIGGTDDVRVAIDADADALHADLVLSPRQGGPAESAIDGMAVGDASPLARLPPDTLVSLMTRDTGDGRRETGAAIAGGIEAALGPRLSPDDAKRLHTAIDDWESARGDWLAAGILGGATPTVAVVTPAADERKATDAVREIVELAKLPAIRGPLESKLSLTGPTFARDAELARAVDGAELALFPREGTRPRVSAASSTNESVAWGIKGGDLLVSLGADSPAALVAMTRRSWSLGGQPQSPAQADASDTTQTVVHAFAEDTSFALLSHPFGSVPAERVTFAWGRRKRSGWARLDVAGAVARELLRRGSGL